MVHAVPAALERLIKELSKFPGIGEKTATRLALYILRKPAAQALQLSEVLAELHKAIQLCEVCFTFSEESPCVICSDPKRNARLVCVVEEPGDLLAIEKTASYKGVYHILHGSLSPMDGIGPDELKVKELRQRVLSGEVDEVLIATSSTVPGEATASYLADMLGRLSVRTSRLACGIPMGMDIKYADMHTLGRAVETRRTLG
ncbi:recombination mediator RecR [Desulfogranum mediterraneum]|uniref:recombination mediator RecR n=1 Tax=Desulfogranum mediterraneum TaxID=160661 RepID=UPI0004279184|nr:recombination mediator RecR [Desulfogranum mediterraneum]